jgi:H2-forming N5,N10-methylenetetrahydromethanopterin dehydrogenase-like enzyme
MTLIDKACYERGCACYDPRVDRDGVEVVQREWVGLTDDEIDDLYQGAGKNDLKRAREIEAKLKEKNT